MDEGSTSVTVLQVSSYAIRYDWNDLESTEPKSLINCMAIPKILVEPQSMLNHHEGTSAEPSASTNTSGHDGGGSPQHGKSFLASSCEKQIMMLRGKILVERKTIHQDKMDKENFLEGVTVDFDNHYINSNLSGNVNNSPSAKLLTNLPVGNDALELKRKYPNDYFLYFPIRYGILNTELCDGNVNINENTALEILVILISKCLRELIANDNTKHSVLLMFSDILINQQQHHLKFVLHQILVAFPNIAYLSVQKDSIMSLYGSGIMHHQTELYTIDMGFTKTSVYSYHHNGRLANTISFPYGGIDIYALIIGILQMSNLDHKIDISCNLKEFDENIRKYFLTLKYSAHQETFQHVHNIMVDDSQKLAKTLTISSDVFYIATNMYFNTKLLPTSKKKIFSVLNPSSHSKITSIDKYLTKSFKGGLGGVTICLTGGFQTFNTYLSI
ncbi:hypothetical protein C9374_006214 [Naegleria lovaniensis]|uniref:Actin-like protein n=1 Tax=Naegleria lovaniensis TaxID=51637 RepID=A0AA88KJR8_NAELO|nr:uncharacterized protein C9374_006214 [Naegleria lovaniensis]KAG2381830.1 hypothetical protein C9374_006214 [Naegleria lovaniensis]